MSNRVPMSEAQVKELLGSRSDREVLDGLRRVVSLMSHSPDLCLSFFPSVVKNASSPSLPIKKLVYAYLLQYSEQEPEQALLSINSIQKALSDSNPQVRALALQTMSGIRVPVITQIVSLAIKKGLGDMNARVREAAALAIPKCWRLDPQAGPQLLIYLQTLLHDRSLIVVGAAVMAFQEACAERIDLIHPVYRRLCRSLPEFDLWAQLAVLRVLVRYARRCFPRHQGSGALLRSRDFYEDARPTASEHGGKSVTGSNRDLGLLLNACRSLIESRNAATVLAAVRCYILLVPTESQYLSLIPSALIALLRNGSDTQYLVLQNIASLAASRPEEYVRYISHFYVNVLEPAYVSALKLRILSLVFGACDQPLQLVILAELQHLLKAPDAQLVSASVRTIGQCVQQDQRFASHCLRLLFNILSEADGDNQSSSSVINEVLTVIRRLVQQDPLSHRRTVVALAALLPTVYHPQARATIIWLVGEYSDQLGDTTAGQTDIAPDVLRILVQGFTSENEKVKLQIVLLAAKVYIHYLNHHTPTNPLPHEPRSFSESGASALAGGAAAGGETSRMSSKGESLIPPTASDKPHPIPLLWSYVLLLTRYDTSFQLRDRCRTFRALLPPPSQSYISNPGPDTHPPPPNPLAALMLLAPKSAPDPEKGLDETPFGRLAISEDDIPPWVEAGKEPDPSLRDAEEKLTGPVEARGIGGGGASAGRGLRGISYRDAPQAGTQGTDSKHESAADKIDRVYKQAQAAAAAAAKKQGGAATGGLNGASGAKGKTLDQWLEEEEEKEEEESDGEGSDYTDGSESDEDDDGSSDEDSEGAVEGDEGKLGKG